MNTPLVSSFAVRAHTTAAGEKTEEQGDGKHRSAD
jgi:hypothetical protein